MLSCYLLSLCVRFVDRLIKWFVKIPGSCRHQIFMWNRLQSAGNQTKDGEAEKAETIDFISPL